MFLCQENLEVKKSIRMVVVLCTLYSISCTLLVVLLSCNATFNLFLFMPTTPE